MRNKLYAGVAFAALILPASAYAQSTGSVDFEEGAEIVVTGARADNGVNGIVVPDTSKSRGVLTSEFINRQSPGQSVNEIINQLPGVSYQSNDPYGSSGGSLNIRGFDSTRISQTFDGVPLNDSGGYAIYGNQQLDPELIEQVNVNFGSTDVDSPTASATGSTVNYRSIVPTEDFGVKLVGSAGDFGFFRVFGLVNTGEFGPFGTRAWFAGSTTRNHSPFNKESQIEKQQYNARIYQTLGSNGDFISLAGHYNENRNNFQGSVPLRWTVPGTAGGGTVGPNSSNRFPLTRDEASYTVPACQTNQVTGAGAQAANSCGSIFDERYNPSNTGNIRGASRFTLMDGLVLSVDPSYQYVKANGGGTVVAQEARRDVNPSGGNANCNTTANSATVSCQSGYIGGTPYFGRDLNGDGDLLDTVRLLAPSQTQTQRIGVISSLRYDITPDQSIRLAYTYDRARHRQTGETGYLQLNGKPYDVFPVNDPVADVNGRVLQKRDRLSFAILHQVAAEYRGSFFDDTFRVNGGIRAPFFRRNLTNYCATSSAAGFVECFGSDTTAQAAWLAANPTQTVVASVAAANGATCVGTVCTFPTQGPQQRIFNYKKILPNVGYTWSLTQQVDVFGNYSKGLQVPGTDNLYNSFYFVKGTASANPKPETSDNFDLGIRYRSSTLQLQLSGWYTDYQNRLAQSYDPDLDKSVYRNLGAVKKYGVDGTIAYSPVRQLSVYAFGSYLHSEIQNDVEIGRTTVAGPLGPVGSIIYAPTAGKREANAPEYTFGGGATVDLDYFSVGFNAKRTGPRYLYDTNEPVRAIIATGTGASTVYNQYTVYGNKTPAYTQINIDARVPLGWAGLNDQTYFQLNVLNVWNTLWVGSVNSGNGSLNQGPTYCGSSNGNCRVGQGVDIVSYGSALNSQIGYPRTFMGTLVVGF
ncbi:TonB-dependent receptor [Sphingomonas hengshuiensis]|uniref:TonB-dependent receptor n=1 Tax=Sphingomonas hengshuiensis TaxID=1609977 RepID=A0A7U5BF20_9SPHN|nr:TonB-dependent receptor [Sphingomonas hengshuiensis]AJP74093.1 TonB-dependent receptor [Sphingomonas hengshuiensis]